MTREYGHYVTNNVWGRRKGSPGYSFNAIAEFEDKITIYFLGAHRSLLHPNNSVELL